MTPFDTFLVAVAAIDLIAVALVVWIAAGLYQIAQQANVKVD